MFKKSIIISGGLGTRMLPITNHVPKASIIINKNKLAENSINLFRKYGIDEIFMTYNHLSEILFKDFNNLIDVFINTTNKDNSFFLTNTFIRDFDEPIIITPCDIIFDINLSDLYNDYIECDSPDILIVPVKELKGCDGDYIHSKNNIITKLSRSEKNKTYCSGIQIINPKKLNNSINSKFENFYDIWNELILQKKLKVSNVETTQWRAFDKITDILNNENIN